MCEIVAVKLLDQIVSGPEINKGNRKTHCSQASLDYLILTSTLLILVLMCQAVQRSICIFRKQLSSFLCKSLGAEIQRDACIVNRFTGFRELSHLFRNATHAVFVFCCLQNANRVDRRRSVVREIYVVQNVFSKKSFSSFSSFCLSFDLFLTK